MVRERLFVIWEGMYQLSMSAGASILSHSEVRLPKAGECGWLGEAATETSQGRPAHAWGCSLCCYRIPAPLSHPDVVEPSGPQQAHWLCSTVGCEIWLNWQLGPGPWASGQTQVGGCVLGS